MNHGIHDLLDELSLRGLVHLSADPEFDEYPAKPWCEITPLAAGACRVLVSTHAESVDLLVGPRFTGFDFYYEDEGVDAAIDKALLALKAIKDGRLVEKCSLEDGRVQIRSELQLDTGEILSKGPYALPEGSEAIDTPVASYEPVKQLV